MGQKTSMKSIEQRKKESKEVKFCYNKAARINFIDEIQKRETKMPSPLTYSPDIKQKFGNIYNK